MHRTGRYGRGIVSLLIIVLLIISPAAAEVCWGKICSSSPLKDSGLCAVCCGGHGKCIAFNTCSCDAGYSGKECETAEFCGSCSNLCNTTSSGQCTTPGSSGECLCKNGNSGICCTEKVSTRLHGILAPSSFAFGSVTNGAPAAVQAPVTFYNPKTAGAMTIQTIALGGANAGDFALGTGTCVAGADTAEGGSCTIPVTFTPSGTGSRTATLYVNATDADYADNNQNLTMSLSGTGVMSVSSILIDPSAQSHVFAGIEGAGIYRSTDSGSSWSAATLAPLTTRVRALVMKPGTSSVLYAGTYGSGVYRSTDGGATWSTCTNTGLANQNVLSLVSNSSGGLYAGTENGVYTSSDCASWTALNSGLP